MRSLSVLVLAAGLALAGCAAHEASYRRSDTMFAQIQQGMTREDVAAITGPPDNTMPFPASRTDSWGFFYHDAWGYYCEFSVTFNAEGLVVSKLSRRLNDRGGRD